MDYFATGTNYVQMEHAYPMYFHALKQNSVTKNLMLVLMQVRVKEKAREKVRVKEKAREKVRVKEKAREKVRVKEKAREKVKARVKVPRKQTYLSQGQGFFHALSHHLQTCLYLHYSCQHC
jgi:hypothetical protein